jgi:hypothetical protein
MPINRIALLLGLLFVCIAIVDVAWATGTELYLDLGRGGSPPTHPCVILAGLVACPILGVRFARMGVYLFILATVSVLAGSAMGPLFHSWTPTWAQHCLAVVMIATSIYAWQQRDYFEDY